MKINLVIEADIASTQLLEQVLQKATGENFHYQKFYLSSLDDSFPAEGSLTLFARCGNPTLRAWINFLKRRHHSFLYFVDDNFWEIRGNDELSRYYQDKSIRRTLDLVVKQSKKILTNSKTLSDYLISLNPNQVILSPFFDLGKLSEITSTPEPHPKEIRIGFAGSKSREVDIEAIASVLEIIGNRFPEVVFEFIGINPSINSPAIRTFDHQSSYENYLELQVSRNWDIALAPLQFNLANQSKTNNKFREFGAMGVPTVFSRMEPYESTVDDGVTGMLADSADEWQIKLETLIRNKDLRETISKNALQHVAENYSIDKVAAEWREALTKNFDNQPSQSEISQKVFAILRKWELGYFNLSAAFASIRIVYPIIGFRATARRIFNAIFTRYVFQQLLQVKDEYSRRGLAGVARKIFSRLTR